MIRTLAIVLISLTATPVAAQGCSVQLLASVRAYMPAQAAHLDPAKLTCNGLAQVYFILTGPQDLSPFEERQRIEAVFRRQGLLR